MLTAISSMFFALALTGLSLAGAPTPLTQLDGKPLDPTVTAGKVVLFVNVASQCGNTPQYAGLQKIYDTYKERGLVVVGVPCNQFGGQEPGAPADIQSFCKLNYGVTFPLLNKQDVNGPGRSELYRSLVGSPKGAGTDIQWNFEKFVVGRDGEVKARLAPKVKPEDPALIKAIEDALASK